MWGKKCCCCANSREVRVEQLRIKHEKALHLDQIKREAQRLCDRLGHDWNIYPLASYLYTAGLQDWRIEIEKDGSEARINVRFNDEVKR